MGDSINPFRVLGIDETASPPEIRTAYLELVKELHPDRLATGSLDERTVAEARMREVNFAYALLTDEQSRDQYRRAQARRRARAAADDSAESPAGESASRAADQPFDYRRHASAEFDRSAHDRVPGGSAPPPPATPWVARPTRSSRFRWRPQG